MFLTDALNVEQYNNLVSAYVNNNFSTPVAYAYQNTQGSDLATIRVSAQQQGISLSTAELNAVNYKVGDIAVLGLPSSMAACSQYGTVLIYDSGAVPKSAVTAARSVTLGSETLQISQISHTDPGAYGCTTSSENSTCYMPANGSLSGAMFSINPGQSRTFASGRIGQLSLLRSTYTTFTSFSWSGPIDFMYTLNFRAATPTPTPTCTSVWSCTNWNACSTSGTQTRACTDLNGCANPTTQPVTGQQCSPSVIPVPPPPVSCPLLSRNLSRGSSGSDVLVLQQFLTNRGLMPTPLVGNYLTGYFGQITEDAVKAYQSQKGIVSSGSPATTGWGVVGPRTRAAFAACSN
jgi:hypothetical protein